MRVSTILKWVGVLIVALVVAAVAIVYSIDVNSYRGEITAEFKKATGRDLTLGGEIDLSISLSPAVVVEDVAISNAEWGSRPEMVRLKRAEAQVELLPLITGNIRVVKLVLIEPDILLETNKEGVPNWEFKPPTQSATGESKSTADADQQTAEAGAPQIPTFDRIEVRDGRLVYKDGQSGEEMSLDLAKVDAKAQLFTAPFTIDVEGAWNKAPFSAGGSIESLASLGAGNPVKLDLQAEAFGFSAKVAGVIAEPKKPAGLDLQVVVGGANLSSLAPIAGPDVPKIGPINVNAKIKGSIDNLQANNLILALGTSDLSGQIAFSQSGPRPKISGSLVSKKIDLTELIPAPAENASGSESSSAGKPAGASDRVFPNDPLPLNGLKAVDVKIDLTIEELITPSVPVRAVRIGVGLANGALSVKPLSATVATSKIDGELGLDASGATPSLVITLNAPTLDLGALLTEADVTDMFQGKAKLSADLRGRGNSVAALMAKLNGSVKMLADDGRLKTQALDAIVGGATAVLGTLFSGKKEWTVVNCVATVIDIKDGLATSRVMLIDTEHSTVTGKGTVNLASEALDLTVEPKAKSVTLNIAVPVHIKGTLASPSFRPDAGATLRKLGGLLGATLFRPAALIGLGELGGEDNKCVKIATSKPSGGAASGSSTALPTSPEKAVEKVKEGAGGLVKGITGGLKGIFGKKN